MSGIITSSCINLIGCHCKVWSHIGYKVETDDEGYQTNDKSLHHISLGEW